MTNREHVLQAIAPYLDRDEKFNGTEMSLRLGIHQGSFIDILETFITRGIIRRVSRGRYRWVNRPKAAELAPPIATAQPRPARQIAMPSITRKQLMAGR